MPSFLKQIFLTIWRDKRCFWTTLLSACILLGSIVVETSLPVYFKFFFDKCESAPGVSSNLPLLAIGYGLIWTGSQILLRFRVLFVQKSVLSMANALTRQLIAKALHPANRKLLDAGHSIEMFHREASQYVEFLFWYTLPLLLQMSMAFGITLCYSGFKVAAIFSTALCLYFVTLFFSFRRIRAYQHAAGVQYADFARTLGDGLGHVQLLHFFNGQKGYQKHANHALQTVETAKKKAQIKTEAMATLQALVLGGGLTALFFLMGNQMAMKVSTVSDLVLVHGYFLQLSLPLMSVGFMMLLIQEATAVFRTFVPLLLTPDREDMPEGLPLTRYDDQRICLELQNIAFAAAQTCRLHHLNLIVKNKEFVVLTGPSGHGKTTLMRLLTQQMLPSSGSIRLWNKSIDQYTHSELFQAISIAPQEIQIFNQSVYENLCCFRDKSHISPQAVESVLRITALYDHVHALPNGLDTLISAHSPLFSRGQLQRLTLARALLKPANLYLFDEPTSALDTHTASEMLSGILSYLKDKTILMVTHRLELMRQADTLVVLKQGCPLERVEQPAHLTQAQLSRLLQPRAR